MSESNRYETLHEMHRQLEEERKAEAEELARRPGDGRGPYYEPLRETHRQVDEELRRCEEELARQNSDGPITEADYLEAKLADDREALEQKVRDGKISPHEMMYELRRRENEHLVQQNIAAGHSDEQDFVFVRGDYDADRTPGPKAGAEKNAESVEQELTKGVEISDSKQARLDRLMENMHDTENEPTLSDDMGPQRSGPGR